MSTSYREIVNNGLWTNNQALVALLGLMELTLDHLLDRLRRDVDYFIRGDDRRSRRSARQAHQVLDQHDADDVTVHCVSRGCPLFASYPGFSLRSRPKIGPTSSGCSPTTRKLPVG